MKTEMKKSMALFSGSVNPALAEGIARELGTELGAVKLEKFAMACDMVYITQVGEACHNDP